MFLKIFTLALEPVDPIQFSLPELRSHFAGKLDEYTEINKSSANGFIYRYPVIQCKNVRNRLVVIGISQAAALLEQLSQGQNIISAGKNACTILERDKSIRQEEFGISGTTYTYEFLTPWVSLNQQNAKKFYDLKGKPERDAFMHKILAGNLATLGKSLDYKPPVPIRCEEKIKFRIDWIERESVIVFLGKFRTNCRIPDYFGIGQSISQGFGTIKCIPEHHVQHNEADST